MADPYGRSGTHVRAAKVVTFAAHVLVVSNQSQKKPTPPHCIGLASRCLPLAGRSKSRPTRSRMLRLFVLLHSRWKSWQHDPNGSLVRARR